MRLEYLATGSADCPLILLGNASHDNASELLRAVDELAKSSRSFVAIHDLPEVEPIANCRLTLLVADWDQGILRTGRNSFSCRFTASTWDNVAGLIEPFTSGESGSQWLAGTPGELPLLLSTSSEW